MGRFSLYRLRCFLHRFRRGFCHGSFAHCVNDSECDDADPCTVDQCTEDCICIMAPIPNCGACENVSCDDGNACTEDVCHNGQCYHKELPDCSAVVPACNALGAQPIGEAVAGWLERQP